MAIRRAKRPVQYEGGMFQGVITEIVEGEGRTRQIRNKGKQVDEIDYARMEFYIDVDAKDGETIPMKHFTGIVLNPDPIKQMGRGLKRQKFYNLFTQTCLQLGVIKESELESVDESRLDKLQDDLAALQGARIQFKSVRTDDGFWRIDPITIGIIGSKAKKTAKK